MIFFVLVFGAELRFWIKMRIPPYLLHYCIYTKSPSWISCFFFGFSEWLLGNEGSQHSRLFGWRFTKVEMSEPARIVSDAYEWTRSFLHVYMHLPYQIVTIKKQLRMNFSANGFYVCSWANVFYAWTCIAWLDAILWIFMWITRHICWCSLRVLIGDQSRIV